MDDNTPVKVWEGEKLGAITNRMTHCCESANHAGGHTASRLTNLKWTTTHSCVSLGRGGLKRISFFSENVTDPKFYPFIP